MHRIPLETVQAGVCNRGALDCQWLLTVSCSPAGAQELEPISWCFTLNFMVSSLCFSKTVIEVSNKYNFRLLQREILFSQWFHTKVKGNVVFERFFLREILKEDIPNSRFTSSEGGALWVSHWGANGSCSICYFV